MLVIVVQPGPELHGRGLVAPCEAGVDSEVDQCSPDECDPVEERARRNQVSSEILRSLSLKFP